MNAINEIGRTVSPALLAFTTDIRNGSSDYDAWVKFMRIIQYAEESYTLLTEGHPEDGGPSWHLR